MPNRLSSSQRTPRSVRLAARLASESLVLAALVLVAAYFVLGGLHYAMIPMVIIVIMTRFAGRLRKKYGLNGQVDDPTKPERFYH